MNEDFLMKILCLNPPYKTEYGRFSRTSRSPAIAKSGTLYYPIWLCYVAGVLDLDNHNVKLIDSCAYEINRQQTLALAQEFCPQLCVIDTSTPSIFSDIEIANEIKAVLPSCFVVLMGTHPTALPEETLKMSHEIDAVIVGEADYTIRVLAKMLSAADYKRIYTDEVYRNNVLKNINGLSYRIGTQIATNKKRSLIENLDELPFVSKVYKKYLDSKKYFFAASDYPEIQIMSSRGCIAKCTYCVYPQTIHEGKYRTRSPQNVADELQWIFHNMPEIKEVVFEDDTFSGNQKRTIDICKELIERGITIKWSCNVRAELKHETMQWMKKAGCVLIIVGYESASEDILINIRKHVDPKTMIEFSKNAHKLDLLVHGCFMVGNRGETRETMKKTLQMALQLKDDTVQFFPLIVYPGTADYQWAKENNLLTAETYRDYLTPEGLHNSVVKMPDMSSDEITAWCNFARKKYYLRPKYVLYKAFQIIKKPSEFTRIYKAFKQFFQFLKN